MQLEQARAWRWVMGRGDDNPEDTASPGLIDEDDPRGVKEQLDAKYRYGGGWRPTPGLTLRRDDR